MREIVARRPWASLGVVAGLLAACGSTTPGTAGVDPANAAFCSVWDTALAGGDGDAVDAALREAPGEARRLLEAAEAVEDPAAQSAASRQLFVWVERACHPGVAAAGSTGALRRVAVPPGGEPNGLLPCLTTPLSLASTVADGASVALFGVTAASDPYEGPMLGLFVGGENGYAGDGDRVPVEVRGVTGTASPITVFQQVVPRGLGTVVAWQEGGVDVGLVGRHWGPERTAELVALAGRLEPIAGGGLRLPAGALPAGYGPVHDGTWAGMDLFWGASAVYGTSYRTPDGRGQVRLRGVVASPSGSESFRFLTVDTRRAVLGDRDVVVGSAWGDGFPVVSWREDDGLVVRVFGIATDLATVQAVAQAARPLDRDEWLDVVGAGEPACLAEPPRR